MVSEGTVTDVDILKTNNAISFSTAISEVAVCNTNITTAIQCTNVISANMILSNRQSITVSKINIECIQDLLMSQNC